MRLTGHSLGYGAVAYGAVAVYGTAAASTTSTETANSGGWFPHPRRKTREEVEEERERLGIIPPKVQAIVRKEAKRSVQKAREEVAREIALPPISTEQLIETVGPVTGIGRDLTIMLALGEVRRGQELKAEMARQQVAWQARYEYELQLEIERLIQEQQDREDEQIVTLLFQRYMH